MEIGILAKVDNLGRIVIPKQYRDFYHLNSEDKICLVETENGILITNPKYKMVEIEDT